MRATALIATAALSLAGLSLAACAAPGPRAPGPDIALYAMDCGKMNVPNIDAFADDGAYKGIARNMVIPCYLIRHPQGDLLWDTGVPEAIADRPGGVGPGGITVARKLTAQLADLGLTPADIEYLSISHSHFDHIGNAGRFATATWIVDPDEKAHAFRAAARGNAAEFGAYSALETSQVRLVEGDAPFDVFGDGRVQVVPAPGHTPGHTVLLVRLAQAGPVLLTGDLWHIAESRAAKRVPRFNTNRAQTLVSYAAVEALAAREGARVVRQHVPEDFTSLPAFPAGLR